MPPHPLIDDLPITTAVAKGGSSVDVRPQIRRRFLGWLALALIIGTLVSSALWHALLRGVLSEQAARRGYELTCGQISGSPFDTVHFHDLRLRQANLGTDVRVSLADVTLSWPAPWRGGTMGSAVPRVDLRGLSGSWNVGTPAVTPKVRSRGIILPVGWLAWAVPRLIPQQIFVRADDLTLRRSIYSARLRGLQLSVEHDADGLVLAREVEIAGPGFANTFLNRHGQTSWQGNRFTLSGLEFGPGVRLVNATLVGTHLDRHRLDWEGSLAVMGGEIRGQGAVNFVHPRLALEVGGSLRRIPVAPLARLLGLAGPAGGSVEQGSFSFRGDPEDWASAEMWLAAQATDFRWRQRDWQSLDLRATVLHRRIQIRRFELQQSRNRVSLTGDCPLPTAAQWTGHWWEGGFACNVDARLEDLHDLAQLFGGGLPSLEGRMSVNGTLETTPGRTGIAGYLNVEGSRLCVRGAPLDYLHATLLFRGDELNVADLQATRGEDYFAGRSSVSLAGVFHYEGEMRLAMSDPGIYAPLFDGVVGSTYLGDYPMRLEAVFYGPGAEGKVVFLTFDDGLNLPVPPTIFY